MVCGFHLGLLWAFWVSWFGVSCFDFSGFALNVLIFAGLIFAVFYLWFWILVLLACICGIDRLYDTEFWCFRFAFGLRELCNLHDW